MAETSPERMITRARFCPSAPFWMSQMISSESCTNHSRRSFLCQTGSSSSSVVMQTALCRTTEQMDGFQTTSWHARWANTLNAERASS